MSAASAPPGLRSEPSLASAALFVGLLRQAIGVDVSTIGAASVERAVRARMAACGLDEAGYWLRVNADASEAQALIDEVVVTETWFFRDAAAFASAIAFGRGVLAGRGPGGVLRLLSLPCATGEEAYSMAMALVDAGLSPASFSITAIDVSRRALAVARAGLYGRHAFRARDLGFRDRYFGPHEGRYRLSEDIRRLVTFEAGNLMDPRLLAGAAPFDIIFCRNVLIYLDDPTRQWVVALLERLLAPGGQLYVGPSEASGFARFGFVPLPDRMTFGLRRAPAPGAEPAPPPARPSAPRRAAPAPAAAAPAPRPFAAVRDRPPAPPPQAPPAGDGGADGGALAAAARLADQGRLDEAAVLCEGLLAGGGADAEACYLLGLISEARGDTVSATGHYRRALYLEPDHRETLAHLALLLRAAGDAEGAARMAGRLQRLEEKARRA